MKSVKKLLAMLLAVIMIFSVMSVGMTASAFDLTVNNAGGDAGSAVTTDEVVICVPETIYLKPSTGNSKTVEYFVNNTVNNTGVVSLERNAAQTAGSFSIYAPGATTFKFVANGVGGYGDPDIGSTLQAGTLEGETYELTNGYLSYPYLNCTINGTGLPATATGLVEWVVTVYYGDDDTTGKTYYAYTTVYSPFYHAVGSVDEVRQSTGNAFSQITTWITGLTGASTSYNNVLGSYGANDSGKHEKFSGTLINEPLINFSIATKSSVGNVKDTIDVNGPAYVRGLQLDSNTSTSTQGGIGYLTIDGSRYTNINEIPNFYIGSELNEAGSESSTLKQFYAWYVISVKDANGHQHEDKYTDSPSGWTKWLNIEDDYDAISGVMNNTGNVDKSELRKFVRNNSTGARFYMRPSASVATIAENSESAEQYIHVLTQTYLHASADLAAVTKYYGNAYASVKFTVIDKTALRAEVLHATSLNAEKYTELSWKGATSNVVEEFLSAYRDAAEILGNPAASQSDIDYALELLKEKKKALKVDITFDAETNGGVFSDNEGVMDYSVVFGTKNSVELKTNLLNRFAPAQYGFEFIGWSTDPDDPSTASLTNVNVTFGDTLYAHYSKTISVDFHYLTDIRGNTLVKKNEFTIYNGADQTFDIDVEDAVNVGDYKFAGWTSDPASTESESIGNTLSGITEDATYYATYKKDVTVNLDANGGNAPVPSVSDAVYYNYDLSETTGTATVTLPEEMPVKTGHGFMGWDINGKVYQPGDSIELAQSTTATALWSVDKYNVTFNFKDADGDDVSVSFIIEYGSAATAPEISEYYSNSTMHYKFANWDKSFDNITGDTVITAEYALGVMHNYSTVGSYPTCEEAGEVVYTCNDCKYSYTYSSGALGHLYVNIDSRDADCEEDGYIVWECSRDTNHKYTEILPATGHSYENTVYVAPTCTDDGYYISGVCANCNEDLAGKVIPALGHTWKVQTEATCEHPGLKVCLGWTDENGVHHECDVTEEIPQLPHDYTSVVVNPTCTQDGKVVYTCSDCGHSYETKIEATGHIYATIIIAPSCTSQGYTTKTCPNCGDSERTDYVDALGHNYVSVVVAPTCTAQGYTKHTCSVCNHSYKSDFVNATGHDYSTETVVAPTCTTRGYTLHECTKCESFYKTDYVDALGHDYVFTTTVQPTDTMNGYDLYVCSRCFGEYKETIFAGGKALVSYTVYGADGAVIPEAKIVLTNIENYQQTIITADENGYFTAVIPQGEYAVKVTAVGYETVEGELFVENGQYSLVLDPMPVVECSCLCHANNFLGSIYRFFLKIFSVFGKIYCCEDCELWK